MRRRTHSAAPATAARESMAPREGGCGWRPRSSFTTAKSSDARARAMRCDHAVWVRGSADAKALPPRPSREGLPGGGSAPCPPCAAQLAQKNVVPSGDTPSTHPTCCQTAHLALQQRIMSSLPSSSVAPHSHATHWNSFAGDRGREISSISPGKAPASGGWSSRTFSSSSSSSSKKSTFSSSKTMKLSIPSSSSDEPCVLAASSSARPISLSSASSRPNFSLSSETCSLQISDFRARVLEMRELVRFSSSADSDPGPGPAFSPAAVSSSPRGNSRASSGTLGNFRPSLCLRPGVAEPGLPFVASSFPSFPSFPSESAALLRRSRRDRADSGSCAAGGTIATGEGGSTSSSDDVSDDSDASSLADLRRLPPRRRILPNPSLPSLPSSSISMASSAVSPAASRSTSSPSSSFSSSSSSSPDSSPASSTSSSSSAMKSSISDDSSSSELTRSALTPATFTLLRYS
mmetsp:Transcript_9331/g.42298  ORF Transcript_9331/g.42298 Transcript_9331/m.42298 type:complete len:462 (+) Transcript_9331:3624-5009(+)